MRVKLQLLKAKIKSKLSIIIWIINIFIPKDNNQIIFYSQPQFSDNSRALFEEMLNQGYGKKFKMNWAVNHPETLCQTFSDIDFVQHRSLRGFWLFLRSKYIITTHSFWDNRHVKNRQVFIRLWHGMPLKKIGALEKIVIPKNEYDFLPTTSELFRIILSKCFNSDLERNPITGLPRNDYLYRGNSILNSVGISNSYNKIVLWMPTFRGSDHRLMDGIQSESGLPVLKIDDIPILNECLLEWNMLLIVKLHRYQEKQFEGSGSYSNIIVLKDDMIPLQYNLYNLVGQVDCLLTDYSSIYIDYLNLNRPIGFVYDDFKEYEETRGFVFEKAIYFMPGKHINTFSELIVFLKEISSNKDEYKESRELINKFFNQYSDNFNSLRVLNQLKNRYFDKE